MYGFSAKSTIAQLIILGLLMRWGTVIIFEKADESSQYAYNL